jgi:hypothetical protein
MSYYDIDQSNRRQYDLWWRMEELDAYYQRKGYGDLDIVGRLLEHRCPEDEDREQYRQDLAQVAFAFLGAPGRDRFLTGSRDLNWGDDQLLPRSSGSAGSANQQKAFAALYSHNVVFDASIDAYRVYNEGRIFDKQTCAAFDAMVDEGLVEIDYKYEHNVGVTYRVDITRAGIERKYAKS